MSALERMVDRLIETPARCIELIAAILIFAGFGWQHTFNAVVNGVIAGLCAAVILRRSGISLQIAGALGLSPGDRILGRIRPRDFAQLREVVVDGNEAQPLRRLAQIRLRGEASVPEDVYDVLVNPQSIGMNRGHPVFRTILFRHRDDHIWPTDIIFEQGVVLFDFRKIDPDLPQIRVSLRRGEVTMSLRRSAGTSRTGGGTHARVEPPARPVRQAGHNRFDQIAHGIIGSGPKSSGEADRMRRAIAKQIHPDRGPAEERQARNDALARANGYLDQFTH